MIASTDCTSRMRIAVLGTRGIPNQYGGFEQFAEYLSVGLCERGHEVAVYLPHTHPYLNERYKGVQLRRVYCPEARLGAAAHFLYDALCLRDAMRRGCDIALECGYQSASLSYALLRPKHLRIVTNMDGLEWNRAKWPPLVRKATRWFESLAVRLSHSLVSDNIGIQAYLREAYGQDSHYIPYGADVVTASDPGLLTPLGVTPLDYHLLIARLEPENHIEMILDGYRLSASPRPFLVVGNHHTRYGRVLQDRYRETAGIRFMGGIYDKPTLDALRRYAGLYFHGHSVGGTNPSLLEAMACGALIAAHDNPFNRSVIQEHAYYFSSTSDICDLIRKPETSRRAFAEANLRRIQSEFSWHHVISQYEALFHRVLAGQADVESCP